VTPESLTAFASVGTLVVIGATALFAAIQLRHARAGNQIAAVMNLAHVIQSSEFQNSRRFVRDELPNKLRDPLFRQELNKVPIGEAARPLVLVANFYEELGAFVKRGIIDADMACDLWSAQVTGDWDQLSPAIAIIRREQGLATFENFEYMVVLGERWLIRHPAGTYPKNYRRRLVEDVWLAEDQKQGAVPR
jgi:hypothetical protein